MADSWHRQRLLSGTTQDAGFISANTAERRWLGGNLSPIVTANTQPGILPDCRRARVSRAAEKAALFSLSRRPLTFRLSWGEGGLREDGFDDSVSGGSSCVAARPRAPNHGCLSAAAVVRLLSCLPLRLATVPSHVRCRLIRAST